MVLRVAFSLLCCIVFLVSCQSSPEGPTVQIEERGDDLQAVEELVRQGNTADALRVWQRLSDEEINSASEDVDLGYLRTRLFSQRMLEGQQDEWFNSQVSALAFDYEDMWLGTWLGGVARYSLALNDFRVFADNRRSLVPLTVYHIRPTRLYVWVLSDEGIKRYDKQRGTWGLYQPPGFRGKPTDMAVAADDTVLVTTIDNGVWKISDLGSQRISDSQFGEHFTVLASSDRFDTLIGTVREGLFYYQNGRILALDGILAPNRRWPNITSIIDDGQSIWIGTSGLGLLRWRENREVVVYDVQNSILPDNWVEDLMLRDDELFLATLRGGFISYNSQEEVWRDWQADSGLRSGSITALSFNQKKIYYGTLGSGIVRLDWQTYREN